MIMRKLSVMKLVIWTALTLFASITLFLFAAKVAAGIQQKEIVVPYQTTNNFISIYIHRNGAIYRMNSDGGNMEMVRDDIPYTEIERLIIDETRGLIYLVRWWDESNQIIKMPLDGSGTIEPLFDNYPGYGYGGQGIVLDNDNNVYLGLYYDGVYKRPLSDVEAWQQIVYSAQMWPGHGQRGQIAFDPIEEKLFFRAPHNGPCGTCDGRRIWSVNTQGGELQIIHQTKDGDGLAIDPIERKLYWSEGYMPDTPALRVMRSNLDGSDPIELLVLPQPHNHAEEFHIDPVRKQLYILATKYDMWREFTIFRVNLDGSHLTAIREFTDYNDGRINVAILIQEEEVIFLPFISK